MTQQQKKTYAVRKVRKILNDLKPGSNVTINPDDIRPGLTLAQLQTVVLNERKADQELITRQKPEGLLVIWVDVTS